MSSDNKLSKNKDIFLRLGLGGIFLANSVTAWVASDDFRNLLTGNGLASHIGHTDALVRFIGVNDAALFLLILSGVYRKSAAIWGSLWLVVVIYVTGFWTPDSIEHLGILALLIYYGLARD